MAKRSKGYLETVERLEPTRDYPPADAVALAKELARARFDETVELHMRTAADTRHAEQLVRGVVVLPHGVGKQVRVLAFAEGETAEIARLAGADYVGADDLIKKIEEGWVEFDVAVATPPIMGRIGRLGRVLGRKGLMPNPRTGTVVAPEDLPRVISEAKLGRVEYRMDKTGIIHCPIGKASFPKEHLMENFSALVDAVMRARPAAIKGRFLSSAYLCTTMGPGIRLDVNALTTIKAEL